MVVIGQVEVPDVAAFEPRDREGEGYPRGPRPLFKTRATASIRRLLELSRSQGAVMGAGSVPNCSGAELPAWLPVIRPSFELRDEESAWKAEGDQEGTVS